jgi:hypothetical protein
MKKALTVLGHIFETITILIFLNLGSNSFETGVLTGLAYLYLTIKYAFWLYARWSYFNNVSLAENLALIRRALVKSEEKDEVDSFLESLREEKSKASSIGFNENTNGVFALIQMVIVVLTIWYA